MYNSIGDDNITSFAEDKLFKNVNDEDARILLKILNKPSKEVKIWTNEEKIIDLVDLVPDIILELDFENLIIVMQSTPVDDEFSKRALGYVSLSTIFNKNKKMMDFMVLSTAEESKIIEFPFSNNSVFSYQVVSLKDLDHEKIINNVEPKLTK